MKSKSELTDFYYKTLYPVLQKLEADREKLKSKIIKVGVIYALIALFTGGFIIKNNLSSDMLAFVAFAFIGGGGILYKFFTKEYVTDFKQKVIGPLIKALDENLHYLAQSHLPTHYFTNSKLFTSSIDRVSGNDYVTGKIDDVPIQFSDFHAEKKHKDSKGRTTWSTIFQGLFIVAEFNKNFHGTTVILPDTAQNTFGNLIGSWLQANNGMRDDLVKMDDTEFEKEFVVYSTDQVEARYILSHSLMKKLLIFKKRSNQNIHVSFTHKNINLAIEYNKDLFEPSVFHSLLKYKIAMEYVETLHLAVGIVEELKLNKKLWSKL